MKHSKPLSLGAKIDKLTEELSRSGSPRTRLLCSLIEQDRASRAVISNQIDQLEDAVDHLQLYVKYLVFDVEATRRERDYFKVLIEELMEENDDYEGNK